jgi:hypothetical protein
MAGVARITRFASELLDRYIAPGVSDFTTADIPEMSAHDPQSSYWVANHFLNSIARAGYNLPLGAHVQHYLRRSEAAFAEHARAREATLSFLEAGGQSPTLYSEALLHWEFFLGQSWHAYVLLRQMLRLLSEDPSPNIFERNDGSVEQRLNLLYNAMKHVESRIDAGQLPENATSPVWLSNRGLECTDGHLTYHETAEVLRFVAKWAGVLVDAKEVANKVKELNEGGPSQRSGETSRRVGDSTSAGGR